MVKLKFGLLNTLLLALLISLTLTMHLKAQVQEVAFADTIGNSDTVQFVVPVTNGLDSLKIGLFAEGEIDIDTLDVKFELNESYLFNTYRNNINHTSASSAEYGKALTIDLDSAGTSYTPVVTTIPKSAFAGYTSVVVSVTAGASGCNAADPKQRLILFVTKY